MAAIKMSDLNRKTYWIPKGSGTAWYDQVAQLYGLTLETLDGSQRGRRLVLGVATGGTMEGFYEALLRIPSVSEILERAFFVGLDEYDGLPDGHEQSYRTYYRKRLLEPLGLSDDRLILPSASNVDTFDEEIRQMGGVDVQLLGIGTNGHVAFNEPHSQLMDISRRVALAHGTREANSRFFGGDISAVPTHAFTMGMRTIGEARWIFLLATGASKAQAVKGLLADRPSEDCPASLLYPHPHLFSFLDREAALLL